MSDRVGFRILVVVFVVVVVVDVMRSVVSVEGVSMGLLIC